MLCFLPSCFSFLFPYLFLLFMSILISPFHFWNFIQLFSLLLLIYVYGFFYNYLNILTWYMNIYSGLHILINWWIYFIWILLNTLWTFSKTRNIFSNFEHDFEYVLNKFQIHNEFIFKYSVNIFYILWTFQNYDESFKHTPWNVFEPQMNIFSMCG